MIVLK